jgi:hypothetical protein
MTTQSMLPSVSKIKQTGQRQIENFLIVWLGPRNNEINDYSRLIALLKEIASTVICLTHPDACVDYITDMRNERVSLVVSESLSEVVVPVLHSFPQLDSVYVLSCNKKKQEASPFIYPKVKGVFTHVSLICDHLLLDAKQIRHDLTLISFLNLINTSLSMEEVDLDEFGYSFIVSRLLKEILLNKNYEFNAKREFIEFCRHQYGNNESILRTIHELANDERENWSIWWYKSAPFLCEMLSHALRTQNIGILHKMGFFIKDLQRQIQIIHYASSSLKQTIYHNQR